MARRRVAAALAALVLAVAGADGQMDDAESARLREGGAGRPFRHWFSQARYGDGRGAPRGEAQGLPTPRQVSTQVFSEDFGFVTVATNELLPFFGQLVTHDLSKPDKNASDVVSLGTAERCHRVFDPDCHGNATLPLARDTHQVLQDGIRVPLNGGNHWLDASTVYGHHDEAERALRTMSDGLLKVSQGPNGDLLPRMPEAPGADLGPSWAPTELFATGDVRANINPLLMCLQTLFHLEHNYWARKVRAAHPDWTDEQVFQRARRYVVSILQKETYSMYVPKLIGRPLPPYTGYNASIDPAMDITFLSVAFRYGHSSVNPVLTLLDDKRRPVQGGHLTTAEVVFNPTEYATNGMDNILRGAISQVEVQADLTATAWLRMHPHLLDLIATDIMRGRERGVGSINEVRRDLGLEPYASFADLCPDAAKRERLMAAYKTVDDVDAYVGALVETAVKGAILGETNQRLFELQFVRMRSADPFHYERPGVLTDEMAAEVGSRTLSDMVRDFTNVTSVPKDLLRFEDQQCERAGGSLATGFSPVEGYNATWSLDEEAGLVTFSLSAEVPRTGWVAVGFGSTTMAGADIVMCHLSAADDATVLVLDSIVPVGHGYNAPVLDTDLGCTADVLQDSIFGEYANGILSVSFTRPLKGDGCADADIAPRGQNQLIFAKGNVVGEYHGHSNRIGIVTRLDSRDGTGQSTLVSAHSEAIGRIYAIHGATMCVVWMFAIPLGIFGLHFHRASAAWMAYHRGVAHLSVLPAITFAIMGFLGKQEAGTLSTSHGVVAVAILFLLLTQIFFGWVYLIGLAHSNNPRIIRQLRRQHRLGGGLLMSLAISNCYLGVDRLFPPERVAPRAFFWGYMCLMFAAYVVMTLRRRCARSGHKFAVDLRLSIRKSSKVASAKQEQHFHQAQSSVTESLAEAKWLPTWPSSTFMSEVMSGQKLLVIKGYVVNIAEVAPSHPGGHRVVENLVGMDASAPFLGNKVQAKKAGVHAHAHSSYAIKMMKKHVVAKLDPSQTAQEDSETYHTVFRHFVLKEVRPLNEATPPTMLFTFGFPSDSKERSLKISLGQHFRIAGHTGRGLTVVRSYTPLATAFKDTIEFAIKLYPNGVMSRFLARLQPGARVRISGPFGASLDARTPPDFHGTFKECILICGGTGLNPCLNIIHHHLRHGSKGCRLHLLVANQHPRDAYFILQLHELSRRHPGMLSVGLLFTRKDLANNRIKGFRTYTGWLTASLLERMELPKPEPEDQLCVVSGPPGFCDIGSESLVALGYSHVYTMS